LDADIKECFDNIHHEYLLRKLDTTKMYTAQIKSWLSAGVLHHTNDEPCLANKSGTPQGGVLSPLLMNVALHGMEMFLQKSFSRNKVKIIRYADDFVVMGHSLEDILKSQQLIEEFLKPIGLRLSEKKTRIGHTMEEKKGTQGPVGLDF
jgi:RNA-directed DNA polymerase